uniref:Two-component response regulator-like APRR2 n=1 Tax=Nicotiana tabacum TaxID=4097 RepID=A0A1S3Y7V5_TOBAC|nr:PREDICTED: two-component response regulator-like APRR2 [Nicotiana tabacum]
MMSSPSELSLECKPHQSYSMLLKSFGEKIDQTQNLEEFVARLEEERVKIDAFKRELPLCMQLLTNAMEASRQQLQSYRENQGRKPVLEEFIPLKNNNASGEGDEKNISNTTDHNKANWMTSAQLWSPGSEEIKEKSTLTSFKETTDMGISKLALDNNFSSPTLALASTKQSIGIVEDNKNLETVNNYSGKDNSILEQGKGASTINLQPDSQSTGAVTNSTSTQQHRKARRCWSPDLHRRFVNALQMLGGSQVATPKQIRELMKVDGLTNDEVKSHLQVYINQL